MYADLTAMMHSQTHIGSGTYSEVYSVDAPANRKLAVKRFNMANNPEDLTREYMVLNTLKQCGCAHSLQV